VNLTEGGARSFSAETVVISTGSRATLEPIPGLADAQPLTPVEALELAVVPAHLLVLGGGYVGLEFAQAMRRFGSDVTIIERNSRLLHREDADVSEELTRLFVAEDIQLVTGVHLHSVSGRSGDEVTLNAERDGKPFELRGSHLLVATGRTPNTSELGLKAAGVERTATGFVQVDDRLRTTASGVFAVGDCAGSPQFTHAAFDDFRVVRDGLAGGSRSTTGRLMPSCLFVEPELARVGLSESEARQRGIPYLLLKLPMKAVLRTRTTGELSGFLKALVDPESSRILGFTGMGSYAGEMLAPVQLAMTAGLPYTALRDSIFAHPTYSEGLVYLFSAKPERPE
jgi:pyruvate/2-oxoglutarate dehydrogenase complex dihydrolipoamide dehydrogenase (E3) component